MLTIDLHTLEATAPKVKPESFLVESAAAPKENPLEAGAAGASLPLSGAAPNVNPDGLLLSPEAAEVAPNLNPPPSVL